MLEQKVDFIDEDEGVLALSSVLRNTVQDRVEDDQHTDGHKLLAEVKDVIADQAVIRVHIGFLGEGVQRTVGKQLDGKSNVQYIRLSLRIPSNTVFPLLEPM